jgi:hypothetical protein
LSKKEEGLIAVVEGVVLVRAGGTWNENKKQERRFCLLRAALERAG